MIKLHDVKSSALAAVGHAGDTLAVQYKNAKVFHFVGISAEQYAEILDSKSVGSSVIKAVKGLPALKQPDPT